MVPKSIDQLTPADILEYSSQPGELNTIADGLIVSRLGHLMLPDERARWLVENNRQAVLQLFADIKENGCMEVEKLFLLALDRERALREAADNEAKDSER